MKVCTASSSRTGKPCQKAPIAGGVVCRSHGGSAPQVKAKARERLAMMVNPSLDRIERLIRKGKSEAVALAASRDVLDRTGYGADTAQTQDNRTLVVNLVGGRPQEEDMREVALGLLRGHGNGNGNGAS